MQVTFRQQCILHVEYDKLGGWIWFYKCNLITYNIFYEYEKWNPFLGAYAFEKDSLNIIYRNLVRLNTSAKFAFKISKNIDFAGTTYVQFPLNTYFTSPRCFFDSNLFFTVNKYLGFVIHYDFNFDTYRPLPIDNYYYSFSTGVNLKF
ncbi:MAG: hypothetical protein ACOVNZ_03540 [Crocinitomicaceae bacterium]